MLIERKRVILGGLVLALAMTGRAWSQAPATQQQPTPATTNAAPPQTATPPSDVPPPLKKPVYTKKKKGDSGSNPTVAPSDVPPPLKRPVVDKKKKETPTAAAPTPTAGSAQTLTAAPAPVTVAPPLPATVPTSMPPPVQKPVVAKKKGKQPKAEPAPSVGPAASQTAASPAAMPSSTPPPPLKPVAAKKNGKQPKADVIPSAVPADSRATAPVAGAPPPLQKAEVEKKKGKQPYTGPNTIIEEPATPMLDADGKQRLDPDGLPMFNPPVKQERDKKGHPLFDDHGKPVYQTATDLGYDDKGKKIKGKKEKVAKSATIAIAEGTLTVDGMISKATLNYEIKDFKYFYMYAPWIGTVVVSNRQFPGAKEQAKAFDQHTLTVTVEEHQFQLYSEKVLLGKKPEPAFVAVDREFKLDSKFPAMGYGTTLQAPYNWPGAKGNPDSKAYVRPPPLPKDLHQTRLLPVCPEGMARTGAPVAGTAERSCVVVETPKAGEMAPAVETAPAAPVPESAPATPPVPKG